MSFSTGIVTDRDLIKFTLSLAGFCVFDDIVRQDSGGGVSWERKESRAIPLSELLLKEGIIWGRGKQSGRIKSGWNRTETFGKIYSGRRLRGAVMTIAPLFLSRIHHDGNKSIRRIIASSVR
jgi:hypothetical protein